jgi:multiple sugar transport system substrate-binding protein
MSTTKRSGFDRRRFLQVAGAAAGAVLGGTLPRGLAPAAAQPVTLQFWHWLNEPGDPLWPKLVEQFQQTHPDIKVNMQLVPLKDFRQKALAAHQAGNPPDVSRIHPAWVGEFYEIDVLQELDERFGKSFLKDEMVPAAVEMGRAREGRPILTLPVLGLMVYIQYYRKDLYDAAGLKPEGSQQDWLNAMKALTKGGVYGFSMRGGRQGWAHGWAPFLKQNGVELIDTKGNIDITSDAAVETTELFASVYWNGWAPPDSITADYAQVLAHWRAGTAANFFHGVHASPQLIETQGDKVQAAVLPYGKRRWTRADFVGFGIWKRSKNQEAAWTFIEWLLQPEQHAQVAGSPIEPGVPALKSVQAMKQFQDNRFVRAAILQRDYWGMLPYWHPYWSTLAEQEWHPNFQKVLQKKMTTRQFLQLLADGFKKEGMPRR